MTNIRHSQEAAEHIREALVGSSTNLSEIRDLIQQVARSDANVLITGETGTGKEIVANLIHTLSSRSGMSLVAVNCAAIPEPLFESELFGHERGAFTHALRQRKGRFELASGSTLMLDDVDDMPIHVQVKLLRALQEGEITRVGGEQPIAVNVRTISTTKRYLRELVRENKFREDLYFRLNVLPVHLPPLRERPEDILVLARHFLDLYRENRLMDFSDEVLQSFHEYHWPGNVRELKHLVERVVALSPDNTVRINSLPGFLRTGADLSGEHFPLINLPEELQAHERRLLDWAMEAAGGNQTRAAKFLGLSRTTLRSKLDRNRHTTRKSKDHG